MGLHLLLLAVAPFVPGPTIVQVCAAFAALVHAALRYPRATPRIVRDGDGLWALPELGLTGLSLGPRTRYTTIWVRLSLVAPTRAVDIVLVVDQLEPEAWRVLQVLLRRGIGAGATAREAASARGPTDLR
jgi:hypothetical protein